MAPIFKFPNISDGSMHEWLANRRKLNHRIPSGFTDEYIAKRDWQAATYVALPEPEPQHLWHKCPEIYKEFAEYYKTEFIEVAIASWLKENCEFRYDRFGKFGVAFEDKSDAVFFKICWMP